jgi:hypothetical protein
MEKKTKKEKIKTKAPLALQLESLRWLTRPQLTTVQGGEGETTGFQCIARTTTASG